MRQTGGDRRVGAAVVLSPDRMAAGGAAIARLDDGRIVFVAGALAGEVVEARLDTVKRDYATATTTRVLEPSPERVEPPCPEVAQGCGGCDWQHLSAAEQQRAKHEVVADALRRTARLPGATVSWGGSVSAWGYRTSMRAAGASDGSAGLRAARSNSVVPIRSCAVADPVLDGLRRAVRLAPDEEVSLRVSSTGGTTAWFHGAAGAVPDGTGTGEAGALVERVGGVDLRVSAGSFFQSGPAAAELLVATVDSLLARALPVAGRAGVLVDAYGGSGLFAATLGWPTSVVVEGSERACADARHNLGSDATVVCSSFEEWDPSSCPQPVQAVVADPSRAGLGRRAAAVLCGLAPPVIVLVSCDPVAMARDARLLVDGGFEHVESVVLDCFPQTHHVEVVTLFVRASAQP